MRRMRVHVLICVWRPDVLGALVVRMQVFCSAKTILPTACYRVVFFLTFLTHFLLSETMLPTSPTRALDEDKDKDKSQAAHLTCQSSKERALAFRLVGGVHRLSPCQISRKPSKKRF
jgi:hypothetical protein